jgi:phosphate-selective porin OprO and OprP
MPAILRGGTKLSLCLALLLGQSLWAQDSPPTVTVLSQQNSYIQPVTIDAPQSAFNPYPQSSESASSGSKIESTETTDVANEIKLLQARIRSLEDKALEDQTKAAGLPKPAWDVRLGGHIQLDYITWAQQSPSIVDPAANNYFSYRRLRLVAEGTGYDHFDFRLQMTLEPGDGPINENASPDVKDAYVTIHEVPLFGRIRLGNFFVPFSLEQVTNDTNNNFLERSIPSQGIFAADREVGIAAYNCNKDQDITLSTGFFFDGITDTTKTRYADRQGYRLSGRGTWLPYYSADNRYLIHTGVGAIYTNDSDRRVRLFAKPQIQRGPILMDTGNIFANDYQTGNVELATVWGRQAIQSEAFLSQIDANNGRNVGVGGAYVHYSYFLTGENRVFERFGQHGAQFGRNQPFANFSPSKGNWGAWEFKSRWSYLDLTRAQAGNYNDLTIGFNWYWSNRMRVMLDWIQPYTDGLARFSKTESHIIGMRFDVNW